MTSESDVRIETSEENFRRVHSMLLRQFAQMCDSDDFTREELTEYGQAMNDVLDSADAPHFIRDQHDEVRETWDEIMEDSMDAE